MGLRPTEEHENGADEGEWVAQVPIETFARRNPGLKSETWATHSKSAGYSLSGW
jgi:hypothetical protein